MSIKEAGQIAIPILATRRLLGLIHLGTAKEIYCFKFEHEKYHDHLYTIYE